MYGLQFLGLLSLLYAASYVVEEVLTCDDWSHFENEDECNYVWDCPDGKDEYNCAPDLVEGMKSFQHPSSESGTWKFQVDEGLGIHINLKSNNSRGKLAIGEGSKPGISELHYNRRVSDNFDISLPISMVWMVYKTRNANTDGLIEINVKSTIDFMVNLTDLTSKEFSSPEYPEKRIHDWVGFWRYQFPTGMGGRIECDVISLHPGQTIEIGDGDGFKLNRSIVTLDDYFEYNTATIQVPHETVWIKSILESNISIDDYNYDYDGSRFHCNISAVMATLTLHMNETVDFDYPGEDYKFVWIGWKVQTPKLFAAVFSFCLEENSFETSFVSDDRYPAVGIGLNFDRSVTPEYSFQVTDLIKDFAIEESAWMSISSTYCSDICHLSYSVSALAPEDLIVCNNKIVVPEELQCNGVYDCSDGRDERGCAPLSAGQELSLTEPSNLEFTGVMIWLLAAEPESFFFIHLTTFLVRSEIRYVKFGTGYYPNDTSTIVQHFNSYDLYDYSFLVQSNVIWIKMERHDSLPGRFHGSVVISRVNDVEVTGGNPREFSSRGYQEEGTGDWIGLWIIRFPEGMGGLIECDIMELDSDHTIEIGVGDVFQLNRIVKLTGWQRVQIAEIQVPYKTVWITSKLQITHYNDYTYYNDLSYRYDGSRFHCSVSAVNATLELLPNKAVDIDIVAEFRKLTWIGWNIQTPESFATVFLFEREEVEGADVGAGIDFEKSVTPEHFFASWANKMPYVVIYGSAWTFLSPKRCWSVCNLSYAVIAVPPEDIMACDGYVYTAEDLCNNISTCINGTDENRCVTARLGGNETITLYPPTNKDTDTIWSVIVERDYQPLLRLKNPNFHYSSQLEIGDGLFMAGKHPVATFNATSDYFDVLIPSRSAWIRAKLYVTIDQTYEFEMEITAKNIDVLTCTDSIAVYDTTEVCNGVPYCPNGEDEIGCEINEGKVTTLLSKGYPRHSGRGIAQTWEYYTTGVTTAMIVHFRTLDIRRYSSELYAGTGKIPGNYRNVSRFHFTDEYLVKDLFFESKMIWMRIEGRSKMLAEIRLVKPEDEIIRCNDDRHIAALDQLCDNLWTCDDGEDEIGCDALSIDEGETVFIDFPTGPHRSRRLVHSWAFRTQQQNTAFAFFPIIYNSGLTQLKAGKGVNVMNTASVRYSKIYDLDRVIYIKGSEAWFLLSRLSGRGARGSVNVTTVCLPAKGLYACEDSDQIVSREKFCDNVWDCTSGLDESDCETTYIDENDNYGFSLGLPLYGIASTQSWVFNISDGREASINLAQLFMYRAQISIGLGSNPTNVNTRLVATIDARNNKLQWKVSAKQFWVKFVVKDGYQRLNGFVEITSVPHRPSACAYEDFQCTLSRECIANNLTCDGRFDCEDRSDEISCDCTSPLEVRCGTGECISREAICSEDSPASSDGCLDEKANC